MLRRYSLYFILLTLCACSTVPKHFVAVDSGTDFPLDETLKQIEDQRVIFVGELHADKASQEVEFQVIKHIHNMRKDLSIAVEIFPASRQDILDRWIGGYLGKKDFEDLFRNTVRLPFDAYEDIFDFARIMGIPVIGIDADKALIANASKNGVKTVHQELLQKIKFSDCSANPEYAGVLGYFREREYHQSGMPFLCDGQRLRDAIMAFNISKILNKDDNSTVVVLTGMMHASKIAVPHMLQKHVEVPFKSLMPAKIRDMINRDPDSQVADYIWY
ncbi:MAG: ChaN family lipoprotein [Nitrospirae bacterium]|nr:ChaN family lipoprotein [Nitrospirota bacterium]